jgi:hypothetical protein
MKTRTFAAVAALALAAPLAAMADNGPPSSASSVSRSAFAGSVASVSSTSLTVDVIWSRKGTASSTETVAIDPSTKIVYGKGKSSIEDGDLVRVRAAGGIAKRIHVDCNCHFAAGTLDAISTTKLRVQVARTGPYDGVLKGNDVTFQIGGTSLPNLSIGDKVAVRFSATGFFKDPNFNWQNATFTIEKLRVAHDKGEAGTNPGTNP